MLNDRVKDTAICEQFDFKADVGTKLMKDMLRSFGHMGQMNENRIAKERLM